MQGTFLDMAADSPVPVLSETDSIFYISSSKKMQIWVKIQTYIKYIEACYSYYGVSNRKRCY